MVYSKKYIQFNNLVFDTVSSVRDATYSVASKTFSASYSFTHGDYTPFKSSHALLNAATVSMTLIFDMKLIDCTVRHQYTDFIKQELAKHGRLWAIQDDTLLWARATMSNYREDVNGWKDRFIVDVNFTLYEGVWHKADMLRTFIVPYDYCTFSDCFTIPEYNPCKENCCSCNTEMNEPCTCECDCVDERDALCFNKGLVREMYDCVPAYRIIYSCTAANKYFGDFLDDNHLGQKFCSAPGVCDDGTAGGIFISRTDIPTSTIRIRMHGEFHNPIITINGNSNQIMGDYKGTLDIRSNGEVYSYEYDCFCPDPLPVDVWSIPEGMSYGWVIHQGNNRVTVDAGTCCPFCVWIESDDITF